MFRPQHGRACTHQEPSTHLAAADAQCTLRPCSSALHKRTVFCGFLTAMCLAMCLRCVCGRAQVIEEHDVDVLRHLLDVRIDYAEDGKSFTIVFEFEANEFFTDTSLTKKYFINLEPEEGAVVFDGPSYEKAEGCKIAFKAGKDVRVKTIQKTQRAKKGSKAGKTRTVTRTEPQPSFFRFFEPPQQPDEDAELTQEQEMALDQQLFQDFEMADYIKDKLVPRAVLWFTGEALDYEDPTEDDEEDEEGLDGDYGDDESDVRF